MNILFVHEVDWLTKVVFDIHTLAESLSLLGHQVYAIDYENAWRRNRPFDLGTLKTREFNGVSRAFADAPVSLRRPGLIKLSGLSRVSAAFTHYLEIKRTIRQKKIDAIVLYSVATNGWQVLDIARKLSVPVIFRSIDILNQLVPYPYLRPATRLLERMVYTRADMILTLTPSLSRYVARLGAQGQRIKLLPMPVDTRIFYPYPTPAELRRRWNIAKEDKVILYIGTLFHFSGLDLVIRHFPEVVRQVPEARFLIVGDGPQRQKLEGIIGELGLEDRVVITGFEPYSTMPDYINLSTICLNPFL
ncbi:MAG: glycosyltransferase, partial [Dehalococcoidales bacterium]|nr:glycosyltransferase [Dehalococcoidales bacterium]